MFEIKTCSLFNGDAWIQGPPLSACGPSLPRLWVFGPHLAVSAWVCLLPFHVPIFPHFRFLASDDNYYETNSSDLSLKWAVLVALYRSIESPRLTPLTHSNMPLTYFFFAKLQVFGALYRFFYSCFKEWKQLKRAKFLRKMYECSLQ